MEQEKGGKSKVEIPPMPIELISLRYRRFMKISYIDYMNTPWRVILRDLELLQEEEAFKAEKRRFLKEIKNI